MASDFTFLQYVEKTSDEMYALLKEACLIPAPSGKEEKRAEFCLKWFHENGLKDAYIDDALNVVCPINCEGKDKITVFAAHTDTVFPDLEPMPYYEKDGKIFCPGAGDDTASFILLMFIARYIKETSASFGNGLLIVCNSCEEGLGNLKGTRQLMKDYAGRIKQFITMDSNVDHIANTCVGSHRYKVTVKTEGGHSFSRFGNRNAIAELSKIVASIYEIEVPKKEGEKTTYNVGGIEGGTSINTIAQDASMLCEYRSTDRECLSIMEQKYKDIFAAANAIDGVEVIVEKIGDRPCANEAIADETNALADRCKAIVESVTNIPISYSGSSTDCNIPLSLGIPAVAVGAYYEKGAHTREEWIDKASVKVGYLSTLKLVFEIAK